MASLNEVTLIGYLGNDPEIRYMPNGDPVATLSIGTTETWKDRESGEIKEHTEWHRVVIFGNKLIENVVAKYLKKGSQIWVRGKNRTRKWVDKDKIDRYTTEVRCDELKMLDRAPKQDGLPAGQPAPAPAPAPQDFDDLPM